MSLDKYKVDVPEGRLGNWEIERFVVSENDSRMDALQHPGSGRYVPPGEYTRLIRHDSFPITVMSDTPDEIADHLLVIQRAYGRCLVAGLGLGMVVRAMLNKPEVNHVDVIEIVPEVIQLVGERLLYEFPDRLAIHKADIFEWKPPRNARWNVCWWDVWDSLCTDNLKQMTKLHRRYGRRCDWQGSWGKGFLQYQRKRE